MVALIGTLMLQLALAGHAPSPNAEVTVTTERPLAEPEQLYFASSLNDWSPGDDGFRLSRVDARTWRIALRLEGAVEYKITRGSWSTVEVREDGRDTDNRSLRPGDGTSITIPMWADEREARPMNVVGELRVHDDVYSPQLENRRTIWVWLPPDYEDDEDRRYPVLYMHDGQNLFDASLSFAGEWAVDETATQLIRAGEIEPIIVVGIANHGADRLAEYLPIPVRRPEMPDRLRDIEPRGERYLDFLVDTVMPMINENYRTLTGPEHTAVAGSSMGGLISLHAGLTRADHFSRIGAMSPSLFPYDPDDFVEFREAEKTAPFLWFDCGTRESGVFGMRYVREMQTAAAVLNARFERFRFVIDEGAAHNEPAWRERLPEMLRFFYGVAPEPPTLSSSRR
jgi:predicted alpha/beta superfamily hydrolase